MKQEIVSKRDVCIYFIIATLYIIIFLVNAYGHYIKADYLRIELFLFFATFYIPGILAEILNVITKLFKIQNEKALKIIKLLFNIFVILYLPLISFVLAFGCAWAKGF